MLLKRFAMLSTVTHPNQQNYNSDSNNNNNNNITNYNIYNKTSFATTIMPESATKFINNNLSVIELKQQQQEPSQQLITPIFLANTVSKTTTATTTTTTTNTIPTSFPAPPSTYSLYKKQTNNPNIATIKPKNYYHKNEVSKFEDSITEILGDDISNYSGESSESLDVDQQTAPERQPSNTYTSTTYYGSGFGVFHQQNARSNGGGIALISGSGGSNGLGAGSYSNGINNNVNLLLGGAMLTLITTILCVVCYCCHRNIKKRTEAAYRQQRQWLENDPNMEIYSVEQCYETSGLFVGESMDGLATIPALHHEPPPSYDAVVAMQEQQQLIIQQHQQQILMQQQLLQQQLASSSSPPPGYRSSLDVSAILQHGRAASLGGALTVGGSFTSGTESNSLASSTANLRTTANISPIDPQFSFNDINGNLAATMSAPATATPTSNRTAACYLRNKQQNSVAANQISQLNMKKVLQAQSCCSLQRAEVENMWNAAAAALAARSAHLASDSRASTNASTSSPTLALPTHKQFQGCKISNGNTPETFGTRYLKQNYYRRGCPLCGKFRYDNDSDLSLSMESNLDTLAGALIEESTTDGGNPNNLATPQNDGNSNEIEINVLNNEICDEAEETVDVHNEAEISEEEVMDDNDNEVEPQCACLNSKRKNDINSSNSSCGIESKVQKLQSIENTSNETERPTVTTVATAVITSPDSNANNELANERQSTNRTASNNNNDIRKLEDSAILPPTFGETTIPRSPVTFASTSSAASTASVTIDLDCINENGIVSLDMSKIIDKTGLPTYDAALKLESSGYV